MLAFIGHKQEEDHSNGLEKLTIPTSTQASFGRQNNRLAAIVKGVALLPFLGGGESSTLVTE